MLFRQKFYGHRLKQFYDTFSFLWVRGLKGLKAGKKKFIFTIFCNGLIVHKKSPVTIHILMVNALPSLNFKCVCNFLHLNSEFNNFLLKLFNNVNVPLPHNQLKALWVAKGYSQVYNLQFSIWWHFFHPLPRLLLFVYFFQWLLYILGLY